MKGQNSFNLLKCFFRKIKQGRKQLVEQGDALALLKEDGWKYIEPHNGPALLKLVNIRSGLSMQPQVYNFNNDIGETDNVAAQHPEMVKRMAAELKQIQNEGKSR